MKLGALQFIRNQPLSTLRARLSSSLARILASAFEAAKHFARMKPGKLIIACRSKEKGEAACLQKETGFSNVHLRLVDLARFSSVTEFANKFEDEEERLDIFVANAALGRTDYVLSEDGWESSVQVNNLSTLLLNIRMLPLMIKTGQRFSVEPRLVVVGSGLHYWAKFDKRIAESSEPLKTFSSKETRQLAKALEKTAGRSQRHFRKELERHSWAVQLRRGAAQYVWAALAENTNAGCEEPTVDTLAVQEPSDDFVEGDMTKVLGEADPKVPIILNDLSSSTV
ncbi:short-chain dehydrogenase [Coprinopsis sp. MPI-PUGE-AT-0042]|nr:short-chain dehydrogenase [Coprinopsis sp. MPI-PUGE-AT-0042]